MRTRYGVLAIFAIAALTLSGCTGDGGPADTPTPSQSGSIGNGTGIDPDTQGSPVATSMLTTPQAVRASDGKWHLAYELLLTDVTPVPVRIDKVTVLDGVTHRALLDVSAASMKADFTPLAGPVGDEGLEDPTSSGGSTTMAPSTTWILWLDVSVATRADVPTMLEHQVDGALVPPVAGSTPKTFTATVSRVKTNTATPTVLTSPVRAGDWYMSEGCCSDNTHHRRGIAPVNGVLLVPQRFAIDFFKVDADHRTWVGDPSQLSSYLSYRQQVIAAAPGTIVARRDGLTNNAALPEPPKVPPLDETVGNFVIEQIGPGEFVLYGHFDPGSVKVKVGQKVTRGQELGLIGTSGNSTTPHLHFQILTTPTFFPSDSVPFTFDQFDLLGTVPDRIWDDDLGLQKTGTLPFVPASPVGVHTKEMPLDRTVVRFK
ncbi:MAG: M23 family metallopeptidase [Microbacteriaceae bacterium]